MFNKMKISMKKKKFIAIRSHFGHDIAALLYAFHHGMTAIPLPQTDDKEVFDAKSKAIYENLAFLGANIRMVEFEQRDEAEKDSYDFVADLAARRLPADVWKELAQTFFTPRSENGRTEYRELRGKEIMLFVPQKLVSDEKCGVSARQKSLPMDVFAFLKRQDSPLLPVLLQNFDRETDLDAVKRVAADFGLYVPGLTENPKLLGLRHHRLPDLYPVYARARLALGTAGTCNWFLLCTLPQVPQIILYHRNGSGVWPEIAKAYQAAGYPVYGYGFDEHCDYQELAVQIERKYRELSGFF